MLYNHYQEHRMSLIDKGIILKNFLEKNILMLPIVYLTLNGMMLPILKFLGNVPILIIMGIIMK